MSLIVLQSHYIQRCFIPTLNFDSHFTSQIISHIFLQACPIHRLFSLNFLPLLDSASLWTVEFSLRTINYQTLEKCGLQMGQFVLLLYRVLEFQNKVSVALVFSKSHKVVRWIYGNKRSRDCKLDLITVQHWKTVPLQADTTYSYKRSRLQDLHSMQEDVFSAGMYVCDSQKLDHDGKKSGVQNQDATDLWTLFILIWWWVRPPSKVSRTRANEEDMFQRVPPRASPKQTEWSSWWSTLLT